MVRRSSTGLRTIGALCGLTALLVLAGACGASFPPARATALLTIVPPAITDTQHAQIADGQHVVFTPVDLEAEPAQRVYVHLTESNTTPTAADPMWGAMAKAGARVIVLAHPTVDAEPDLQITAIPELLATLLRHLARSAPTDGWEAFLTSEQDTSIEETIEWDKIIIAGHRDGASRAALLGSQHPVDRTVLFSGTLRPTDFNDPSAPPDDRIVVFNNSEDELSSREALWVALGVPTEETKIATQAELDDPSFSLDGNRFISGLEPIDGFNVRNDWQHTRYRKLWEYVCCE